MLVNPNHEKTYRVSRPTYRTASGLAKILIARLLKGSFIPTCNIRELHVLVRYKTLLTQQVSSDKNRLIKILKNANIKLYNVLFDVFGVTG